MFWKYQSYKSMQMASGPACSPGCQTRDNKCGGTLDLHRAKCEAKLISPHDAWLWFEVLLQPISIMCAIRKSVMPGEKVFTHKGNIRFDLHAIQISGESSSAECICWWLRISPRRAGGLFTFKRGSTQWRRNDPPTNTGLTSTTQITTNMMILPLRMYTSTTN